MENKKKTETVRVATYFSEEKTKADGSTYTTKYLKFGPKKDKNKNVVGENPFPLTINEGDVLFVNVMDEDFKEVHGIPEYIVGSADKPLGEKPQKKQKADDNDKF